MYVKNVDMVLLKNSTNIAYNLSDILRCSSEKCPDEFIWRKLHSLESEQNNLYQSPSNIVIYDISKPAGCQFTMYYSAWILENYTLPVS